jgi:hypothetical protein
MRFTLNLLLQFNRNRTEKEELGQPKLLIVLTGRLIHAIKVLSPRNIFIVEWILGKGSILFASRGMKLA